MNARRFLILAVLIALFAFAGGYWTGAASRREPEPEAVGASHDRPSGPPASDPPAIEGGAVIAASPFESEKVRHPASSTPASVRQPTTATTGAYGAILYGRIIDESGSAVPRAQVTLEVPSLRYLSFKSTRTDALGRWCLSTDAGEEVLVRVADESFLDYESRLRTGAGATCLGDIVLASGLVVSGHVVKEDGAPFTGATVMARAFDSASGDASASAFSRRVRSATTLTDESGSFHLSGLTSGTWTLVTRCADWVFLPTVVEAGASEVVVVARWGGIIRGRVVDEAGRPVCGLNVGFQSQPENDGRTETEADGSFELTGLCDSTGMVWTEGRPAVDMSVDAPASMLPRINAYDRCQTEPLTILPGRRIEGVVLVVRPALSVSGSVLDADGHRMGGARITASRDSETFASATSAADGSFEFRGLASVATRLEAELEGWVSDPNFEFIPGKTPEPVIRLVRPATLRGRIAGLAEDERLELELIEVEPRRTRAIYIHIGAEFELGSLFPGTIDVVATDSRKMVVATWTGVVLKSGETTTVSHDARR